MTRRPAALLASAALVIGAAVPAAAAKPTPSAEFTPHAGSCWVSVDVAVPKGGPRISTVAVTGATDWTSDRFLNGQTETFMVLAPTGTSTIEVVMTNHRETVVHRATFDATCAPPPSAT